MSIFKDKVVLITGGTGSWGNELTKQLLEKNPKKIIIYSRSELNQVNMQRKFNNPKLKFIIGDIRDLDQVNKSFKGVDYVFHLAGLEEYFYSKNYLNLESLFTNSLGTKNLLD
ncbi:SDR family NAD(P)-dependent oxidoreductase, partial [bacterium]|nr:SDR family NAD(P)-dependent oxidoreductase [bacterium]